MAKKKSVFEKLGLIEQIEEDLNEEIEDTIFEARKEFITEEVLDEEEMTITEEELSGRTLYNQDEIFETAEPLSEEESITRNLFSMPVEREEMTLDEVDPFEKLNQEQSMRKEKIEAEIREYEKISQDYEKKSISKEVLLGVDEIYARQGLNYDKRKTIFMVNEFIQALPESLPIEIKRTSVKNIVAASGINLNELMNDAYIRLETLNQTLQGQIEATEGIIERNNKSIEALEAQILEIKKANTERHKKQEESKNAIEYETQRILNIVQFINPEE